MLEAQKGMPTLTDATVAAGITVTAGLLLAATRPREQQLWDWLVDSGVGGEIAGILLSVVQVSLAVLLLLSSSLPLSNHLHSRNQPHKTPVLFLFRSV
ncbi:hypothetical protein CLOM_g19588, partial [Closterium sp. NIES-68]